MVKVLLAGESWASAATHTKGFDQFGSVTFHTGADRFLQGMAARGIEVTNLHAHEAAQRFPLEMDGLAEYDVLILSDIGANTLLLHPDVWLRGQRVPNRLKLIERWVREGGGLIMVGGYFSFQGIDGKARWGGTAVEDCLPVRCLRADDRIEIPEGAEPVVDLPGHALLSGVPDDWPYLLGVNEVTVRGDREDVECVLSLPAEQGGHPLLVAGTHHAGRTIAWTSDMSEHWLPRPFLDWPGYDALFENMVRWVGRDAGPRP